MKKIPLSQLFNPAEYHAPLLSSWVKKKILSRTVGATSLLQRIMSYSGVSAITVLVFVFLFYYGARYTDDTIPISPSWIKSYIQKDVQGTQEILGETNEKEKDLMYNNIPAREIEKHVIKGESSLNTMSKKTALPEQVQYDEPSIQDDVMIDTVIQQDDGVAKEGEEVGGFVRELAGGAEEDISLDERAHDTDGDVLTVAGVSDADEGGGESASLGREIAGRFFADGDEGGDVNEAEVSESILLLTHYEMRDDGGLLSVSTSIKNTGKSDYLIAKSAPVGVSCYVDFGGGVGYRGEIESYLNWNHAGEIITAGGDDFAFVITTDLMYDEFLVDAESVGAEMVCELVGKWRVNNG